MAKIFGTQAYSIYSGDTETINKNTAKIAWVAILRFLHKSNIINLNMHDGYISSIISIDEIETVKSDEAGILYSLCNSGDEIKEGDIMAKILDPFTGELRCNIISPVKGTVFFTHHKPLIHQHTVLFKIVKFG